MAFRLTFADQLEPLADLLADELARPPADPFAAEIVAVPGDGVRAWLTARLARRLGATGAGGDGIVANVRFVFPAQLVRTTLGLTAADSPWSIGRLTWAIHAILATEGAHYGLPPDAVRCRAIADLFDQYQLHRPGMVRCWERGLDVDALSHPLPSSARWQAELWRALVRRFGVASDAEALATAATALRRGELEPGVATRAFLFGLAGLPQPHLDVLQALGTQRDVHVLAPAPSMAVWQRLRAVALQPLTLPVPRSADPSAGAATHQLGASWGRTAREAELLLLHTAAGTGASVEAAETTSWPAALDGPAADLSLLRRLQHAVRGDERAPGAAPGALDFRPPLAAGDRSIQLHRCYGPARQVEVLRDIVVRLLEEVDSTGAPVLQPRDISILCPDVATFAPLADAAFAGDPEHGVPAVPLRIADRSLRQEAPLLDAVGALLDLLDGRFRASAVLAFAARGPVRARFGFEPEHLGRLATWIHDTHVSWGLDAAAREAFGVPSSITTHTWQAGLDQLLVGAAMAAGGAPGPGGTIPYDGIDDDDVELLGCLAEMVRLLSAAVTDLAAPQPVGGWCARLGMAANDLLAVPAADAWQWLDLDHVLADLAAEAGDDGVPVAATELAAVLGERLSGPPASARFDTGAVTMSSLTAQRGVPRAVVCVLGLDGDVGGGQVPSVDDLMAAPACVGDRDARSELRAQLLDAVMSARHQLIICCTGHDVRSNALVPPAVPLAELLDVVDATVHCPDGSSARNAIAVNHPRQAWSEANFRHGELVPGAPWSFDRGAQLAAIQRRSQRGAAVLLSRPLPAEPPGDIALDDLVLAVLNPVQLLLSRRLGVFLPPRLGDADSDDLVPLELGGLDRWQITDSLLRALLDADRTAADHGDDLLVQRWADGQRRAGALPPGAFGAEVLATVVDDATAVRNLVREHGGVLPEPIDLVVEAAVGARCVSGVVGGVHGSVVVETRASRHGPRRVLDMWVRLVALSVAAPEHPWQALVIGRPPRRSAPAFTELRMRSAEHASRALEALVALHEQARRELVPALANTTHLLWNGRRGMAGTEWTNRITGEGFDRWVRFAFGDPDFDQVLATTKLQEWSTRLWGTLHDTTEVVGFAAHGAALDAGDASDG